MPKQKEKHLWKKQQAPEKMSRAQKARMKAEEKEKERYTTNEK